MKAQTQSTRYFTYIYLDPRKPGVYIYDDIILDHEPFYVGMGTGNRDTSHVREAETGKTYRGAIANNTYKINKIRKIVGLGLQPIIRKCATNLSRQQALDLEVEYIRKIGRYDLKTGPLTNRTNGGESTSGMVHSEKTLKLMSEQRKGKPKTEAQLAAQKRQQGRELTENHKKNISAAKRGKKSLTDEQYKQIAEKLRGGKRSEKTLKLMSEQRKGKPKTEAQLKAQHEFSRRCMESIMPLDDFKIFFKNSNSKSAREWKIFYQTNDTPKGVYSNPVEAYKKRGISVTWNELLGKT